MTYRGARRVALLAYRKAVEAGEKGDWEEANRLVSRRCCFCEVEAEKSGSDYCGDPRTRRACPTCPALAICRKLPDVIARNVMHRRSRAAAGLRKLAQVIAALEALEIPRK